jgi:hypothetical protein
MQSITMPREIFVFLLVIFSLSSLICKAAVITVPDNYSTIQAAIDAAIDHDEVVVSPGTYNEHINFSGKNIMLRSTDPTSSSIVASTIISGDTDGDGYGDGTVVTLSGTESGDCVLSGFTITKGTSGDGEGGGIYGNNTLATIENNIISGNSVSGWYLARGGGIFFCNGIIQNNIISNNSASSTSGGFGGGLFGCNGTIQNNTISSNSASGGSSGRGGGLSQCSGIIQNNTISNNLANSGGGLYSCGGTIQNNIISGNDADHGGGLYQCVGTIQNNIISGNSAHDGGGLYWAFEHEVTLRNNTIYGNSTSWPSTSGPGLYNCDGTIINCIIWGNTGGSGDQLYDCPTPSYSCIQDWTGGGTGNISSDPQLVDPANGDFHLQAISPCIDAGAGVIGLTEDFEGDPRPMDTTSEPRGDGSDFDIGADEFPGLVAPTPTPSPTPTASPSPTVSPTPTAIPTPTPTATPRPPTPIVIRVPDDYLSIQAAIDAAIDGDEIIVSPATYNEHINFSGKNIVLRSTDPTSESIVASTIISGDTDGDGNGDGTAVTFSGTESGDCVLSGFTITKGTSGDGEGGGISGNNTLATIENNIISGNGVSSWASGCGGGIARCNGIIQNNTISNNSASGISGGVGGGLYGCSGTIQGNVISDNIAYYGSGGGFFSCGGIIQNNAISGNSADHGGGLFGCGGIIQNNTISANSADMGGGFSMCNGTIQNNIISSNSADSAAGLYYCVGTIRNNTIFGNSGSPPSCLGPALYKCTGTIINCIVWENTGSDLGQLYNCSIPSYSCVQDWTGGGTGNISSDPQLVDPDNGDFHLQATSPCIDAGGAVSGLTQDFEGDPRPMDGTSEPRGDGSDFDIGADEYPGMAKLNDYTFDLSSEEWTSVTLPLFFSPPNCNCLPGKMVLVAQDNIGTFGYWSSEEDALQAMANCLYRIKWTVATDVTDPLQVPQARLRVNSQNLQQADALVVSSVGDGSYAPTPEGRTYEMYFVPPESCLGKPEDQDDLVLSFDILNFDPNDAANGSLMLDEVAVDAFHFSTLDTPVALKTWDFNTDANGWAFGSSASYAPPLSTSGAGALWLTAQSNTNTFGFWSGPSDQVLIEAGKLYRLRFTVTTDVTFLEQVPQLRLRAFSEDFQATIAKVISSVTGAEMSPTPQGRTYDLYFYPPQSLVGTDADSILAAFDILNFDPADAPTGTLMLDSVTVESLDVP